MHLNLVLCSLVLCERETSRLSMCWHLREALKHVNIAVRMRPDDDKAQELKAKCQRMNDGYTFIIFFYRNFTI